MDGTYEKVPYFRPAAGDLTDVIAPSCMSCFLYPNDLADIVVGYMGAPYDEATSMGPAPPERHRAQRKRPAL